MQRTNTFPIFNTENVGIFIYSFFNGHFPCLCENQKKTFMFLSGEYRIKLYLKRSPEAYKAGLTKEAYIGFMRVVLRETRE
jgi:hypothetical protein